LHEFKNSFTGTPKNAFLDRNVVRLLKNRIIKLFFFLEKSPFWTENGENGPK
jgi:hypothetical protein